MFRSIICAIVVRLFSQSLQSRIVLAFFYGEDARGNIMLAERTYRATMRTNIISIVNKQSRDCMKKGII